MEFISQWFWFFLLLPIAAVSGWVVGRRGGERHSDNQVSRLSTTYFRGLNYLLNEQPDKAIEIFLHIAELDKDTFETQVALGHLFRRRGEVDRAIRLHQALVQRPGLSDQQKVQALLALGEDYMRSGLLDRAETVFSDLVALDLAPLALRHLIGIYQSERDWDKAIENARRYEAATGEPMGKLIAQFECELADRHRAAGDSEAARAAIKRAYEADANSVRAGMLEGRVEVEAGNDPAAIRAFERVARADPDYLPEVLPSLLSCYERDGDATGARAFLAEMCEHYRGIAPVLALTRMVEAEDGVPAARAYLARQLKDRPSVRGEAALIDLTIAENADPLATLHDLKHITDQLLVRNPSYRCKSCGFGARSHHWQCPSCKEWGTIKPLLNYAVV
ncbi:lipopolysaccharide assembly protein LapB [Lysobacter capsici]|jgi:lipopolysaccharide biosynthesis regulator YciM|uniref:Lipopolysaccharide assembly protein B n=1 Tax=Lysobacter capsici AZ78 TaxID=1444315 RepID=A0A108U651_9GAMM|nr:lipopolysaccharide assembly protein LapB [Lysobacter capsici]ALN85587.1 TPR repeat family protein [Lysobacter capsici]ATE71703.1 lipopolysaccharide assembly protein LapB [Lysobacter capsici]KWS03259.1 Heat shock (predicted periplasmic) protein YciM, precursor [Lysobacter capsici AZ78]UOF17023.1 lipopolysaccharide assembly protein LapB [Lysobacter capsici]WND82727.1 lipopolysaccharide assembly protein LapB [Lysobacter capsici]